MMRTLYRMFWLPFYRRWALRHVRRSRIFRFGSLKVTVPPGVFHPGIYFSTPIFLKFLRHTDFHGKKVLDLGTGSGVLGLFAARSGADVTASDISGRAVDAARANAQANLPAGATMTVVQSDLFDALPPALYDLVLINPPYYARRPRQEAEHAFFAGENLEYFDKLFRQMPSFLHPHALTWMILSEDCDYAAICDAAERHNFFLLRVGTHKKWGERFFTVRCTYNYALTRSSDT